MTRYKWVAFQKAEGFPIATACKVAGVSRQGFHAWRKRQSGEPSEAEVLEAEQVAVMREIEQDFDCTYGEPRMTPELAARGYCLNHKRVERLMRKHLIVGVHKRSKVRTTIPAEINPPIPDLVGRRFTPGEPDQVWVGDITYIRTTVGWLYLASVLDLGSRRLLGYSMANHMRTELVEDALKMAIAARGGAARGIIFHGDRGAQYLSGGYQKLLRDHGMRASAGRTGVCWDNSVAESFWSSLKRELVHRYRFDDHRTARRAIFAWINHYNNQRLHSALGYIAPVTWEQNQTKANQAA